MIMSSSIIIRVCWALLFCLAVVNEGGYGCCFGCPEEERVGLLQIKQAFNFTNDNNRYYSSWGGQEHQLDCCSWEHLICDFHSKRVVQLLLEGTMHEEGWYMNMSLFLPFQQLQNLSLRWNGLRGFIGEFKSTKLQHLDLSGNSLEEIPPFLKGMKSLTYLALGDNHLTNLSRFEDLTSLTSLETLILEMNHINGEIPPSIRELTTLKALSLRSNMLVGTLNRKGLCMLRNLEELDLSFNRLTGSIPCCLSNLTSLRFLELSENLLSGNIPPSLFSNLKSLQYLSLSYNHFEGLISFSLLSSNSKLEVFQLDSHNSELEVDTENPPWTPLFQLKILRLSNCKLNEPTHAIPTFLVHQHDLRLVNMSHNGMKGNIPSWLLTNNLKLEFLSLRGNFLTGPLLLYRDLMNLQMVRLDISGNRVQKGLPDFIGSVFPNLQYLNMSTNLISGSIPASLGLMVLLQFLDLSNNHFVGEIPESLTIRCTSLKILKISNNKLQGPLLPPQSNLFSLRVLYLDNNQFSGLLPRALVNSSNNLSLLDISSNSISGELPDWLGDLTGLTTLVLSANSFQGQIPPNFCNLNKLRFLDLSQNKFTDSIPSCANLGILRYLHLHENNFSGLLPHVLSQSRSLVTLDIRDNQFSGEIPDWITSLSDLRVFVLKNNGFTGSISSAICQLTNISILDLSGNKFAGLIPPCLSQIPIGNKTSLDDAFEVYSYGAAASKSAYDYNGILHVDAEFEINYEFSDVEEDIKFMTKNRLENYKGGSILRYMSGIDLSGNQLVGSIPKELGYLSGILTLNLSHNQLTSSIPTTFGNMKEIESLDLSYNNLSGSIPSELTQLTFLSAFSVAHNNLSGRTPEMKAQFSTFNSSSYEGNPLLCGPPLEKSCFESPRSSSSSPTRPHEEDSSLDEAFWWGFMISSVVAFSGVVSFLYYSSYYRYKLFSYVEDITGVPLSAGT